MVMTIIFRVGELNMTAKAVSKKINLRSMGDGSLCIALDETVVGQDLKDLLEVFGDTNTNLHELVANAKLNFPDVLTRQSGYLEHPNFNRFHSETEMLRYLRRLESRDLSLCQAMIPLGSCTMKLNATAEMIPITWPELNRIHPFAPAEQTQGYAELIQSFEDIQAATLVTTPADEVWNCVVAPEGSTATKRFAPADPIALQSAWYRGQIVRYLLFENPNSTATVNFPGDVTSNIMYAFLANNLDVTGGFATEPQSGATHNVVTRLPQQDGYSPLWTLQAIKLLSPSAGSPTWPARLRNLPAI